MHPEPEIHHGRALNSYGGGEGYGSYDDALNHLRFEVARMLRLYPSVVFAADTAAITLTLLHNLWRTGRRISVYFLLLLQLQEILLIHVPF